MSIYSDIPGALRVPHQFPLDAKTFILDENSLSNLGTQNNLAYTYGEGLIVYCQVEKTRWEWKEEDLNGKALLVSSFVYPNEWIGSDDKDYSNLRFNFYKITNQSEILDRLDFLENLPGASTITAQTGFSLVGLVFTVNPLWIWTLNGFTFSNITANVITIPLSPTGKKRIEYIVPNDLNGFDRVSGPVVDETGIAVAPSLLNKGMYVTFYTVTDSLIEEVADPNIGSVPGLQEVTEVNAKTTKPISVRNANGLNGISIHSFALSFWKWVNGVSIYSNILIDNITETYIIQLPNKIGGAQQTMAMVSDVESSSLQSKVYENGELQIFRKPGTPIDLTNKEPNIGDYCIGFVEGQFINTNYLGPDKTLLTSYYI